jgi:hypothetical protein
VLYDRGGVAGVACIDAEREAGVRVADELGERRRGQLQVSGEQRGERMPQGVPRKAILGSIEPGSFLRLVEHQRPEWHARLIGFHACEVVAFEPFVTIVDRLLLASVGEFPRLSGERRLPNTAVFRSLVAARPTGL